MKTILISSKQLEIKFQDVVLFLNDHDSIFASSKWHKFLKNQGQKTFYLMSLNSAHKFEWILPIVKMNQSSLLNLLPSIWVSYDGPFWSKTNSKKPNKQIEFLNMIPFYLKDSGISMLKGLQYNRVFNSKYIDININLQKFLSSIIDLNGSLDDIWGKMEGRARTAIRKANRIGVDVKSIPFNQIDEILPNAYAMYLTTYKRAHNKKALVNRKSFLYISNLFKNLGNDVQLFVTTYNNMTSSMAIILKSKSRAIYFLGGSDYDLNKVSNSSTLLQWSIIKSIKQNGIKYYDLGGLPINQNRGHPSYGIYKFKKQFGGSLINYYSPYYKRNNLSSVISSYIIDNALRIKSNLIK